MADHVCVILAKSHSTRLPHKNRLSFDGLPLYRRTIDCAKISGMFDEIIIDTDDSQILAACSDIRTNYRAEHVRGDDIPSVDVILSISNIESYKTVTLLQTTSPLRTPTDVQKSQEIFRANRSADSLVSVVRIKTANRIFYMNDFLEPISYRMDEACVTNGAIWSSNVLSLRQNRCFITSKTIYYEMPKERSVDIDTRDDFLHALSLWNRGYGKDGSYS